MATSIIRGRFSPPRATPPFVNVEQDLGEKWTLIGGIRGAIDKKHINQTHDRYLDCPDNPGFDGWLDRGNTIGNGGVPTCGLLDPSIGTFNDANALGNNKFTKLTWSGKIEADYKPSDLTLVYLSASHGSKAAMYNNGNVAFALFPEFGGSPKDFYVKPEEVYAGELGLKTRTSDGNVRLTANVYYYHYPSFHLLSFISDTTGNIQNTIASHKASNYGAETDLTVKPISGITLNVNAGYTRMRVKDVSNAYGIIADRDSPLAPKWTVNAMARYDHPFENGSNFGIQADMHAQASFYTESDNFDSELVPSRKRFNVRADYTGPDGRYVLAAYVNNVFNSHDLAEVFDLAGFGYRFSIPMQPRWFGVQATYKFK